MVILAISLTRYPLYLRTTKRPVWLCVERVLNCHDVEDTRKGRVWYRQYIKQRVDEIADSKYPYELDLIGQKFAMDGVSVVTHSETTYWIGWMT